MKKGFFIIAAILFVALSLFIYFIYDANSNKEPAGAMLVTTQPKIY